MRSSRLLTSTVQTVSNATSSALASLTAAFKSTAASAEENTQGTKHGVHMSPTQSQANLSEQVVRTTLNASATRDVDQPDIFRALLPKTQLTQQEVDSLATKLIANGKAKELDALASQYKLSSSVIIEKLSEVKRPEAYQGFLAAKGETPNLQFLFDPNSNFTIVEASDKTSIVKAKLAAQPDSVKRIVQVDTDDEYSPTVKVEVVQRHARTNQPITPTFFKQRPRSREDLQIKLDRHAETLASLSADTHNYSAHC